MLFRSRRTKHFLINYDKSGVIYEEFGIRYLGTIEATNIPHIMGAICYAKNAKEPVIIHVLSKKGYGYTPAEQDPTTFHGLGKFNIISGEELDKNDTLTYTQVFGKAMLEEAKNDKKVVVITAAMAEGTGLALYQESIPERFVDVGIAEEHAVTFAGGLAVQGLKPVVAIYSTFMQRAYDQIIHDVALQKLPVLFVMDRAGLVGEDGPTHHGSFDLSYLRLIPNMVIMAPKDECELRNMLYTATLYKKGPIAMRYPRGNALGVEVGDFKKMEIGKGEVAKEGKDIAKLAIGNMVHNSMKAAEILSSKGIDA